ncbi:MAG: hypothetical protein AB8B50_13630 [Pirellulaceae bacterium]
MSPVDSEIQFEIAACNSEGSGTAQQKRRRVLKTLLGAVVGAPLASRVSKAAPAGNPAPAANASRLLVRPENLDSLATRAKVVIELEGKLQLKGIAESEKAKPREAEVKAKSTLDYFETLAIDEDVVASRRYVLAESENWITGKAAKLQLRPECRETVCMFREGTWQQFCPAETIDARETQLLQSPINTALLETLLPKKAAKPNSSWAFENEEIAKLFNLEAVHKSSLTVRILKVEKGKATLELKGDVEATANSVPTKLSINGNVRAEFGRQCLMITWLGLSVTEKRSISRAEPGFEVTARIRMIRAEVGPNKTAQNPAMLRQLATEPEPGRWLVRLQSSKAGFTMFGDRRWKMFLDSREDTVLRFIDNNTVVAQCNISRLTNMDAGTQVTLEGVQADIKKSLQGSWEEFVETDEQVTSSNLRLIRTVSAGTVEDVPIQWIHNHLSDDEGRRFAMICTMGANMTDQFAANDLQMTGSFRLLSTVDDGLESQESDEAEPKLTASKSPSESVKRK